MSKNEEEVLEEVFRAINGALIVIAAISAPR